MNPQRIYRPAHGRASQRGQAMIFTVLLIVVGVTGVVYTLVTPSKISIENDKKTAAALAEAKTALIGYAASDANRPGELPCPDVNNDGQLTLGIDFTGGAGSPCMSLLGRLPWKTLGLPDLRDGSGERLWYALSDNFHAGATPPLNSDTAGQLTITGTAPASAVIAIVFSSGAVVGAQVRDAANENNVANYLEGGNETGIATNTFVSGQATASFNDRLLPITSDALFSVVAMRVAREVSTFLTAYFKANDYYPFATRYTDPDYNCTPGVTSGRIPNPSAPLPGLPNISVTCVDLADWLLGGPQPPNWFITNNWHLVTHYAVAPACTIPFCLGVGGFLTVNGVPAPNNDKRALVIVTGRAFSGQSPRPCFGGPTCSAAALLEDAANTDGGDTDTTFVKPVFSPTNNDRLVVVSP